MARIKLDISRRSFLKGGLATGGLALMSPTTSVDSAVGMLSADDPWYREGDIKTTYNVCDICPWRCGVVVRTVNGVVRKIDGNPADPKSRGMLCARGQGGVSFMYDPDRLQSPMIRTGERGSGQFKEVTWEEALDYVAAALLQVKEEHGEESLAVFGHTSGDHWFADHFAQAWGTPNAAKPSSSLCLSPRDEAATLTYGSAVGGHEPVDWDTIQAFTLIGSHIGEDARNTLMQDFANAQARGAKVIVVDPRFSSVAAKADYWLPIKPGTDTALMLAWMNVLITESLYDAAYVEEWTQGFEELAAHVAEFTPDWAAGITDLPAAQIRETALVMAENMPAAAIVPGRHTTWYGNDSQRMRSTYRVNALLGAYGREGGMYFNKSVYLDHYPLPPYTITGSSGGCSAEPGEVSTELALGPTGKARADGVQETFMRGATAMQELIDPMISGDPYPIKALMVYGVNLLNSIPNRDRTIEALKALDFVVAIDVLPQEHIAWADVVLPEATYLERYEDLWAVPHKTPYIAMREPAVEPLHDSKPGWWISRELGMRVGLDEFYKWETIEEWIDKRLISVGSSLEDMRAQGGVIIQNGKPYLEDFDGSSPFHTASGKINLYSEELAEAGHDPMPVYEPIDEPPAGYFRLLYGRNPVHTFAKTQNTPVLNDIVSENEIWVNAGAAEQLGVKDGEYVMLENQDGARSGPVKVKATQRIRHDAVFMAHGFGQDAAGLTRANGRGASDTKLQTRYKLDPISGGAGMRVNFVRLDKEGV
ncbi:MAG: molybdopterin-dependent oxidoreductase [Acidimicrobiia bacterium]|nr:molybdopterin-dependent oxidoreductase [Acidimicrobiia bacterium]MDX2467463.1 molybdopterin-dependent oxidoreductase [Acidimicrobiia bacterium]